MKAAPRYDISEVRKQIEQGKTTYRKPVEVMEEAETVIYGFPVKTWRGTGKFEMREVSREEFYRDMA